MFPQAKTTKGLMVPGNHMSPREPDLLAELEIPKGDKPKPVKAAAAGRGLQGSA